MKGTEYSLRDFWDNIISTNIQVIGISEEKKEKNIAEIIVENISNMGKKRVDQVQEAQKVPHRIKQEEMWWDM